MSRDRSGEREGDARGPQWEVGGEPVPGRGQLVLLPTPEREAVPEPAGADPWDEAWHAEPPEVAAPPKKPDAWPVYAPEERHVRSKQDILRTGERAIEGFRRGKVSGAGLAGLSAILRLQIDVVNLLDAERREAERRSGNALPPPPPGKVRVTRETVTVEQGYDLPPAPPPPGAYPLPVRDFDADDDLDRMSREMEGLAATPPTSPAVALGHPPPPTRNR